MYTAYTAQLIDLQLKQQQQQIFTKYVYAAAGNSAHIAAAATAA